MDGINFGAPDWPYQQVAAALRTTIAGLPPQTRLPAVRDLGQQFGVSEKTARKAYQLLQDEGLVFVRDKRGFFTAGP